MNSEQKSWQMQKRQVAPVSNYLFTLRISAFLLDDGAPPSDRQAKGDRFRFCLAGAAERPRVSIYQIRPLSASANQYLVNALGCRWIESPLAGAIGSNIDTQGYQSRAPLTTNLYHHVRTTAHKLPPPLRKMHRRSY